MILFFRRNVEDYFSEILPTTVVSPKRNTNINNEMNRGLNSTSNPRMEIPSLNKADDNDGDRRRRSFNVAGLFIQKLAVLSGVSV